MLRDSFRRRMFPMYIARFLCSLVFWYSIEKLFMVSIGFTNETIAVMVAVYSAMSVLMEIPSGILADRWSRKGVLALAALCLAISSLLGGMSDSVALFIVAMVFWGFYDALSSGTDSAIIYDTLVEERGHADDYEKEFGIYQAIGGGALFIAGISGGLLGDLFGLRTDFFLAVPITLMACIFMLYMREGSHHKQSQESQLGRHIRDTFRATFRNPNLLWIMISMLAISLTNWIGGEMYQLWYIAVAAPIVFFGIAGSLINTTWGLGGLLARFLTKKRAIIIAMLVILVSAILLVFTRNIFVILVAQIVLMILANGTWAALTGQMHRQLPARVRAGAGSAANTAMRLINIPLILFFGWVAQHQSIFTAAWILVALVGVALASEIASRSRTNKLLRVNNA